MLKYRKRCIHCGTIYSYQASGHDCHREENDAEYCPGCKNILIKALENVPVKYRMVWEFCNDFTLKEVKEIIKEDIKNIKERAKKLNIIALYPIEIGLFDLKDRKNENKRGKFTRNNKHYNYSYWTKKGKFDLYVAMELNIETGDKSKFWENFI